MSLNVRAITMLAIYFIRNTYSFRRNPLNKTQGPFYFVLTLKAQ